MKNTEIFNDYDMVVSITEKTLNDQLTHLVRLGTIRPELILYQGVQDGNYVYQVLETEDQIPRGADGNPLGACIAGQLLPQVSIAESGTNITFVLQFRGGSAWFWQGSGPLARLVKYDMTGWKYGVIVTLDLKTVEKEDIGKGITVPDLVKDQLYAFTDAMFTVNHLFMDFESTDLLRFDPAHTDAGGSGDVGMQQLVLFMEFYLKDLVRTGNPYILGYSLTTDDATQYPPNQQVPDDLKPVGTTYTMYHDPAADGLSNLNFVLATRGGHAGILGTPGNFDSNWIGANEQCDGKMVISHDRLIEKFILQPFYQLLSDQVYGQIKGNIDVPQGNDYASARSVTDTGLAFTISNVSAGDDQYVNTFTVDITNTPGQVDLAFHGHIALYKEVSKNMGFCTADAHASGAVDWSGTVTLVATKDAQGNPTLSVTRGFQVDNSTSDSDKNDCAKAFEWIGKILGAILDVLTLGLSFGFFEKLFDDLMDLHIPGIGDLSLALGSLGNSVSTTVLLPAGSVFFFKDAAADTLANLSLELTYKSES